MVLYRLVSGYAASFSVTVTKAGEPLYIALHNTVFLPSVEVVLPEFLVRHLVFQYVVAHDEYLMPDSNEGLFLSPSSHEALVFGPEVRAFHPRCHPCELREDALQTFIAVCGGSRFLLPRAFVVAGTHPRPGREGASPWGRDPCSPPSPQ